MPEKQEDLWLETVGERKSALNVGIWKEWLIIYALCDLWHDELTHCEEPCETKISLWMPGRGDYDWRVVELIKNLSKHDCDDADFVG